MITSEVQRTLVKSPPELWSELSDPEALARHLGELGDIRITRVEPESLVEWEAEGTTGTVEIKASGWGTRVTLTVLRELPDGAPTAVSSAEQTPEAGASETAIEDAAAEPDGATAAGADEPEDASAADEARGAIEPQADEPDGTITAEADGVGGTIAAEADAVGGTIEAEADETIEPELLPASAEMEPGGIEPEQYAESVRDTAGDEARDDAGVSELDTEPAAAEAAEPVHELRVPQKPAPATEAARRAAGWPSASYEPEQSAAETPETVPVWSGHDDDLDADEPEPGASEPRGGFFARLFRRRRRTKQESPAVSQLAADLAPEAEAEEADTPEPFAAIEEPLAGVQLGEPPAEEPEEELLAEEPLAEEPIEEEFDEEPLEEEEPPLGKHEPEATQVAEPDLEPPVAALPPEDDVPSEVEHLDEASPGDDAGPDDAAADLSAELLAAEEVAAEQVEAVLSAALDRLGSAHHRPFSRS